MDIPVKSKPPGYGHSDLLPHLAQPDFEAGLQTARNPSEPPDPAPDVCHARLQFRRRSQGHPGPNEACEREYHGQRLHEADSTERAQRCRGARPANSQTREAAENEAEGGPQARLTAIRSVFAARNS